MTYDPSISDAALESPVRAAVDLRHPLAVRRPARADRAERLDAQLLVDDADDPRIATFIEEYWQSQNVPEPGALCTGAIDAPGKVS